MHAVVVSQYFPPETGGTSNRLGSLVEGFIDAGHEVTVIAEKPNYPKGIIWDEYRGGFKKEGNYKGARVIHVTILEDRRRTFFSRVAFFLSFVVTAVVGCFYVKGKVDVVVASSPPLFVGLAGWLIAKLRRARFLFDVRDLWPEVAVAMGELSNPRFIALATKLEHFLYRRSDAITAVTESFCDDIRTIVPNKPIHRVTNGTVPELFRVDTAKVDLRRELGLPDAFTVGYIGNFGLAQGLHHVVEAAGIMAERDAGVHFLMVGDGSAANQVESLASDAALTNLELRGRVSLDEAAQYMAAADVLLVPLGNHPIYQKFIPSKLFDSMAAARPLLLSVDGESRSLLEEAQAGWYYPAEEAQALADLILKARIHADELTTIGLRGRDFVQERFSRRVQAQLLVDVAESLAGTRGKKTSIGASSRNNEPHQTLNKIAS